MIPTFFETRAQLNISQIEEVEEFVGLKFPNEYRQHLIKHNGGKCTPNVASFIENGEWTESAIREFYAIYDDVNGGMLDDLKECIEVYKTREKRMPKHMLPIAYDSFDNQFCISCGKDDEGYIYFWDHEKEVDYTISDDTDYSNLYFSAKSFSEFLANLKSLEEFI